MVISADYFQQHLDDILCESLETEEPVILKTGLGNFFVLPEHEYRDMMSIISDGFTAEEDALTNMR